MTVENLMADTDAFFSYPSSYSFIFVSSRNNQTPSPISFIPKPYKEALLHGFRIKSPSIHSHRAQQPLPNGAWIHKRKRGRLCFRCGSPRHLAVDCRNATRCFTCGHLSHKQFHCPRSVHNHNRFARQTLPGFSLRPDPSVPLPPRIEFLSRFLQLQTLIRFHCNPSRMPSFQQKLDRLLQAFHLVAPLQPKPPPKRQPKPNLSPASAAKPKVTVSSPIYPFADSNRKTPISKQGEFDPVRKRNIRSRRAKTFEVPIRNAFEPLASLSCLETSYGDCSLQKPLENDCAQAFGGPQLSSVGACSFVSRNSRNRVSNLDIIPTYTDPCSLEMSAVGIDGLIYRSEDSIARHKSPRAGYYNEANDAFIPMVNGKESIYNVVRMQDIIHAWQVRLLRIPRADYGCHSSFWSLTSGSADTKPECSTFLVNEAKDGFGVVSFLDQDCGLQSLVMSEVASEVTPFQSQCAAVHVSEPLYTSCILCTPNPLLFKSKCLLHFNNHCLDTSVLMPSFLSSSQVSSSTLSSFLSNGEDPA